MASWEDVVGYVKDTYEVEELRDGSITLAFDVGDGRLQNAVVSSVASVDGDEWLIIESAIGELADINLRSALARISGLLCGGLAMVTDTLVGLRHAVPIENLDVNEFERPLALVTLSADHLEALLDGRDRF